MCNFFVSRMNAQKYTGEKMLYRKFSPGHTESSSITLEWINISNGILRKNDIPKITRGTPPHSQSKDHDNIFHDLKNFSLHLYWYNFFLKKKAVFEVTSSIKKHENEVSYDILSHIGKYRYIFTIIINHM